MGRKRKKHSGVPDRKIALQGNELKYNSINEITDIINSLLSSCDFYFSCYIQESTLNDDLMLQIKEMKKTIHTHQEAATQFDEREKQFRDRISLLESENRQLKEQIQHQKEKLITVDTHSEDLSALSELTESLISCGDQLKEDALLREEVLVRSFVEINALIDSGDMLANQLAKTTKENAKLNVQLSYLSAQNKRFQNLIERVNGTWYGKRAINIYHFLNRIH